MNTRRNTKLLLPALIVMGACFCFVQSGHASADPFLDGKIKVQYDRIASWAHDGHVVGWLVFSAFLIGLLVTTLHLVPLWWMKILTAVLSFTGAVIIGYYHQFFPADDRAYDKAVRDARGLLDDFSIQLEGYPSLDTATRTALEDKFRQLIVAIGHIEDATIHNEGSHSGIEQTSPSSGLGLVLLPSAEAQPAPAVTRTPDWIERLPRDENNFYFLGKGSGRSFDEARQNALLDARKVVTELLAKYAKESPAVAQNVELTGRLVTTLASGAEIADTFVAPEPTVGYQGYALLRLSRSGARYAAESVFVQTSTPYDNAFLNKVQKDSKN